VIAIQYSTRIAPIEIHGDAAYPLYSAEGRNRTRYYLPPISGGYYTPFLWCDGRQRGTSYSTWRAYIESKIGVAAYVTVTSWGVYLQAQDSGRLYLMVHNDSTGTMKGYIRFTLTEDSCYYVGPNNDPWHNHVARDYIPDTSGTFAQLAPHDSVIVYRNFRVGSGWDENRCKIVYWFQNDSLRADSSKPVYQAGIRKVMDLAVGIEEIKIQTPIPGIDLAPNPCLDGTRFSFPVASGSEYRIRIFDITGRQVCTLSGVSRSGIETVKWNCRDDKDKAVGSGVYLYRFESPTLNTTGKIVVK
jgi:hypothetical protein